MKQILTLCALISVACSASQKKGSIAENANAPIVKNQTKPRPAQNEIIAISAANHEILKQLTNRIQAIEQGLAILINSLVRDTNHEKAVAMAKAETAKRMQAKAVAPMAKANKATSGVKAQA